MKDFFEIDESKKTVKILKLDDFSVEDLKIYMNELNKEVDRVKLEIDKKINLRKEAEKLFK